MAMVISLVLSVVGMWYIARYLPQMPVAGQMVLSGEIARGQTLDAGAPTIETVPVEVGDRGLTLSVLRPAGKARIRNRQTDVVTEGEMVESGVEVEVIDVRGNHIVVRELASDQHRLA
jgi:membrane-bound serine protease (ClpP class)